MELRQDLDHLVLGRCIVSQVGTCLLPDLLHGAPSIHQTNEAIGCRGEAVVALRGHILQDVPQLAAVVVAVDMGVTAQAGPERRNPVP